MGKFADAIKAAGESLAETNWHKGSYFSTNEHGLCMCAHGALQAKVNPAVIAAIAARPRPRPAAAAAAAAAAPAEDAAAEAWCSPAPGCGIENRPYWVKASDSDETYGSVSPHYILGMVGLTASFNDAPETTLEMVKEKFEQAYELAERLGV